MTNKRQRVVIAGATGFVGRKLIDALLVNTDYEIVGLSRFVQVSKHPRVQFKLCDLFSLLEIEEALKDATAAFYLVHSMLPSANLDQGHFYDYDLLLADNFARACKKTSIQHIIYLGGLVPTDKSLSAHLLSRLEVEKVFAENQLPVTVFRSGMIIGAEGSSFQIMERLVRRLPLMLCPRWTSNLTNPVDIDDVVKVITECLLKSEYIGKSFDLSGPKNYTYLSMMQILAKQLKLKRWFIALPVNFVGFSKLWVRLITRSSKELVYPLLDSLKHSMLPRADHLFMTSIPFKSYEESLNLELTTKSSKEVSTFVRRKSPYVRSIQRLVLPPGMNADDVAREYMRWLPQFLSPVFFVKVEGEWVTFSIFNQKIKLLILKYAPERSSPGRALFYVRGGLLAKKHEKSRFEFRETLDRAFIITGIQDFVPSLPWPIYRLSQALIHLWVTHSFGRHLARIKKSKGAL